MFQTVADAIAALPAVLSLTVPLRDAALAAGLACLALVMLWLRRRRHTGALHGTITALEAELSARDAALTAAQQRAHEAETRANRLEAQDVARDAALDHAQQTESDLRAALDVRRDEIGHLQVEMTRIRSEARAAHHHAEEKIDLLQKMRAEMETRFRELSHKALESQGAALAKSNIETLKATLSPLQEHVGHFEKALKSMHETSQKERVELRTEITNLTQQTARVSQEAVALTNALRSDQQKQGAWGEMILERILESSGLREGEEYEVQAHRETDEGRRLRPDVVVNIPGGKSLVIDSKVSLTAYTDLVNAETDADAAAASKRHLLSVRSHIDALSSKGYHAAEDNSVDYVVLFIPIEGAFSEALRLDGGLTTHALERNVTIATPTTLMMALKTVANVWAVDRRNRNAEDIARRAGLLYDKVAGFVDSMEDVGKRLDQAQGSYARAFDQLSRGRGNVLGQIDQLKTLGARATKTLDTDFDAADAADTAALPEPAAAPD